MVGGGLALGHLAVLAPLIHAQTFVNFLAFLHLAQGDFEELVGYEEDCTPASLPEVNGEILEAL